MLLQELTYFSTESILLLSLAAVATFHVVYQIFFHPLAEYPGPFLCSLTDIKKFRYFATEHVDQEILQLHQKYGPIVRIAPNEVSFWNAGAVAPIYKSGRAMLKGPFYDGFTALKPNLFGMRDEELHALRRRQMAHSFSAASLTAMESIFDHHLAVFRKNLDRYADSGEQVDLKNLIAFYVYDVLGQLAFSTNFNSQLHKDVSELPPINGHIWLSSLSGSLPAYLPWSMKVANYIPSKFVQSLIDSRNRLRQAIMKHVQHAMDQTEKGELHNKTLLSQLINAKDPETGEKLTVVDLSSEAFGFLVAGSHTTSASLTLLFYHLLHTPEAFSRATEEMRQELPALPAGSYPYTGLEHKLPYTMACIKEGFRMSPVFTMPLTRIIVTKEGLTIDGNNFPRGTNCSISNHSLHHNPDIWGDDHDTFRPERWLNPEYSREKSNYLMPFGMGHRACIGRNIAMINIMKVLTTLMRCYELQVVDTEEVLKTITVGIGEKDGPLWCWIKPGPGQ